MWVFFPFSFLGLVLVFIIFIVFLVIIVIVNTIIILKLLLGKCLNEIYSVIAVVTPQFLMVPQ